MKMSPEDRQRVKQLAADNAGFMNDIAAVAAGLAVVSFPLPVVAAGFGIVSATAWLAGNRWQAISNDPPRDDFDKVDLMSTYERPIFDLQTNVLIQCAAMQLQSTLALHKLLVSLERYDGAVRSIALSNQTHKSRHSECAEMQLIAIEHNARQTAKYQVRLHELASQCNVACYEMKSDAAVRFATPTLRQVQDTYALYADGGLLLLQTILGWNSVDIRDTKPSQCHPIVAPGHKVMINELLFRSSAIDGFLISSEKLQCLVTQGNA